MGLNVFWGGFCCLEGLSGLDYADFSHNVGLVIYGLGCHLGFQAYPFGCYLKYAMLLACSGFPILNAAIATA